MPKEVEYYVDDAGNNRYASSGTKMKDDPVNNTRITYVQVDTDAAEANLKRKRRATNIRNKEGYRITMAGLPSQPYTIIPEGKREKVGHNRDSVLRAVNAAYAASKNIPLNRENRLILNRIYADEMNSAIAAREADFQKYAGQFSAAKKKGRPAPTL